MSITSITLTFTGDNVAQDLANMFSGVQFSSIQASIDGLTTQLEAVVATTKDIQTTMGGTLNDVSAAQSAIDAELQTIATDQAAENAAITAETAEVTANTAQIATLNATIATLNAQIAAGTAPPDASAQVADAQAELASLQAEDAQIKAETVALGGTTTPVGPTVGPASIVDLNVGNPTIDLGSTFQFGVFDVKDAQGNVLPTSSYTVVYSITASGGGTASGSIDPTTGLVTAPTSATGPDEMTATIIQNGVAVTSNTTAANYA